MQCFAVLPTSCGCEFAAAAASVAEATCDRDQGVGSCCCAAAERPHELPHDGGYCDRDRPDVGCHCGCSERAPSFRDSDERIDPRHELCEIAESIATGELTTVSASTLRITDCSFDHSGPSLRALLCVWRI